MQLMGQRATDEFVQHAYQLDYLMEKTNHLLLCNTPYHAIK